MNNIYAGLNEEEVKTSRNLHGTNLLTPPMRPSLWKLYLEKFKDPIIRVLLIAAFLSLVISIIENEYAETIGIIVAILLATGIGFYFEYDANKKFDILNSINEETPIKVIRNGKIQEIPKKDIVVGDIVLLETGEEVPADGELIEATSLLVNESSLTGELSVHKTIKVEDFEEEAVYASNCLMRSSTILEGHAIMRVTQVGDATEIGKVAQQGTNKSTEDTPLNKQLSTLAKFIGYIGFSIAALTFLIFTTKDIYFYMQTTSQTGWDLALALAMIVLKYFMMSVTLIVVAVPEGLPMSVTLSLALNMKRMLKTNNLVRKMHACETIGAVTVICTDKTGTLTQNKMTVKDYYAENENISLLVDNIGINTTAHLEELENGETKGLGNPTEVALLQWIRKQGYNYRTIREDIRIINQLPFSTERKYMSTLAQKEDGKMVVYIKGAPEVILAKCSDKPKAVDECLQSYQNKAMRTLALAYKYVSREDEGKDMELLSADGFTFQYIIAITDPIRDDVPTAVKECLSSGVNVKIITGDTTRTAKEIARQIGLWTDEDTAENAITGVEFAALSDEEALNRCQAIKIMSRARPTDKQRMVQLLQKKGEVVAVTGDGTNDAPALNHAQVGLSMGSGTSIAKEASDITLLDDSFNSISTAIMWGRSLYKNIQRFIVFQLTINFAALLIVLIGSFIGTELPLTVTQMLWVNLIMDTFAAMALASIPPSKDVMKEKPRKSNAFIITKNMAADIIGFGTLFIVVLMVMTFMMTVNGSMTPKQLTVFFTTFVMLQFWNLLNAQLMGTTKSIFTSGKLSWGMGFVLACIMVGQILIVEYGGVVFRTIPISIETWFAIIGYTSAVLWLGEIIRLIKRLYIKENGKSN